MKVVLTQSPRFRGVEIALRIRTLQIRRRGQSRSRQRQRGYGCLKRTDALARDTCMLSRGPLGVLWACSPVCQCHRFRFVRFGRRGWESRINVLCSRVVAASSRQPALLTYGVSPARARRQGSCGRNETPASAGEVEYPSDFPRTFTRLVPCLPGTPG